jgi:hypothetical protein
MATIKNGGSTYVVGDKTKLKGFLRTFLGLLSFVKLRLASKLFIKHI